MLEAMAHDADDDAEELEHAWNLSPEFEAERQQLKAEYAALQPEHAQLQELLPSAQQHSTYSAKLGAHMLRVHALLERIRGGKSR
jgi:hypothetical protein